MATSQNGRGKRHSSSPVGSSATRTINHTQDHPSDDTTLSLDDVSASNERQQMEAGVEAAHKNEELARQMVSELQHKRQQSDLEIDKGASVKAAGEAEEV